MGATYVYKNNLSVTIYDILFLNLIMLVCYAEIALKRLNILKYIELQVLGEVFDELAYLNNFLLNKVYIKIQYKIP